MRVYEDNSKTELVAEIPKKELLTLFKWEHVEYSKKTSLLSVPIKPNGSNEVLDILVSASISFGTEFSDVCRDWIELCINTANAECFLYVNDGVEDDVWGCVELSNEEFFTIINQAYGLMEGEDRT